MPLDLLFLKTTITTTTKNLLTTAKIIYSEITFQKDRKLLVEGFICQLQRKRWYTPWGDKDWPLFYKACIKPRVNASSVLNLKILTLGNSIIRLGNLPRYLMTGNPEGCPLNLLQFERVFFFSCSFLLWEDKQLSTFPLTRWEKQIWTPNFLIK